MARHSILIVDDEQAARYSARRVLDDDPFEIAEAAGGDECLNTLDETNPDLILLDYMMPDRNGLSTLKKLKERGTNAEVIMMTARGSEEVAVEAMKNGAFDYIVKPYETDELRTSVEKALEKQQLERENRRLEQELEQYRESRLIGESDAIREVRDEIEQVAPTDASVVITGETGTGKELAAREIHQRSQRDGPLRTINCAAIPENLIESELFGHEKGAFTGADQRKRGKFEQADGGTLFLDEIGEMSPAAQKRLLRVLEEQSVERVGGEERIDIDVRVLSATNRNLEQAMEQGTFRDDLYYRINVVELQLPPLRKRRGDVKRLAQHFLQHFCDRYNRGTKQLSENSVRQLQTYTWPGNVRELRNVMERAVILSGDDETIQPEHLSDLQDRGDEHVPVSLTGDFQDQKQHLVETFERRFIKRALRETGGNVSRAAESIGMYRQNLQKKIQKLEIDVDQFRADQ